MVRVDLGWFLSTLARAILSFIPALLRPDDLIELTRRKHLKSVDTCTNDILIDSGFLESEEETIKRYKVQRGHALILFCGVGRDAIALAKLGLQVTGIDFLPEMVLKAREHAKRLGLLNVNFLVQEVTSLNLPQHSFDYVIAFSYMYSAIPTRERRIKMLDRINRVLKPGGLFIFSFFSEEPTARQKKIHKIRKLVAYLTMGNTRCQLGDRMLATVEFYHYFCDKNEVYAEAKAARFNIEGITISDNSGYGVLRS